MTLLSPVHAGRSSHTGFPAVGHTASAQRLGRATTAPARAAASAGLLGTGDRPGWPGSGRRLDLWRRRLRTVRLFPQLALRPGLGLRRTLGLRPAALFRLSLWVAKGIGRANGLATWAGGGTNPASVRRRRSAPSSTLPYAAAWHRRLPGPTSRARFRPSVNLSSSRIARMGSPELISSMGGTPAGQLDVSADPSTCYRRPVVPAQRG